MLVSAPELRRPHGLSRQSLLVIMVIFPEFFEAIWCEFSILQYFFGTTNFFSICKLGAVWVLLLHGSSLSFPTLLIPFTYSPTTPISSASLPNPSFLVYQQSQERSLVCYSPGITSSLFEVPAPSSFSLYIDDLPIALRWGKGTCTQHQIARFVF
jgi:hypothetical protein